MNNVHSRPPEMRRVSTLRSVDLNLLVVFDAIGSEGTLTGAGQKLGLTQPAVSHALARLRDVLADPLFTRQGGRMVPTPYARHLTGEVRRSMAILEQSLFDTEAFEPRRSTATFRIALPQTHEATILAPLYARLAEAAPNVTVHSIRVGRRNLEPELANGQLDLAIDLTAPVGLDIVRAPLFRDRMVVTLRRDHPLTASAMTLENYLSCGHILISSRRHGGGVVDHELNRLGLQRRIALRCQSTRAAVAVAAETDLLLTLADMQLAGLKALSDVTHAELPLDPHIFEPEIYWHSRVDADPANLWLRQTIIELFRKRPGRV